MATPDQSIREIIAEHLSAAAVLMRFEIDVHEQAETSLGAACQGLQLSVEQVLEKLEEGAVGEKGACPVDPASLSLSRLIQYIVRVHHRDVRSRLPRLADLAKVAAAEPDVPVAELKQMARILEALHRDMQHHFIKEEGVLFPYIAQIDEEGNGAFLPAQTCFRRMGEPVFMMAQEHEQALRLMAELDRITCGYRAVGSAPESVQWLYAEAGRFSHDLREHIRLENEVLFPRALAREAELMKPAGR